MYTKSTIILCLAIQLFSVDEKLDYKDKKIDLLSVDGLREFKEEILAKPSATQLDVSKNSIGNMSDEFVEILSETISSLEKLERLSLAENALCNLSPTGVKSLFNGISKISSLKYLWLDDNMLEQFSIATAREWSDGFKKISSITHLSLKNNRFVKSEDKEFDLFLEGFSSFSQVQVFDLGGISAPGDSKRNIYKLIEQFVHFKQLRALEFQWNEVGLLTPGAIKTLFDRLGERAGFKYLSLKNNRLNELSMDSWTELFFGLKKLEKLEVLDLRNNNLRKNEIHPFFYLEKLMKTVTEIPSLKVVMIPWEEDEQVTVRKILRKGGFVRGSKDCWRRKAANP
jgi:Leucine-rich repeat (LRR) protein